MSDRKILVLGAAGQIGTELVIELRNRFGNENVVAADIKEPIDEVLNSGPFEVCDATSKESLSSIIEKYQIDTLYHLVAMLSATAEKFPMKGWDLNMTSLFHALELLKEEKYKKLFWPSSIAAFGPTTPKDNTPQDTIMDPSTVYGISKQAGERWCEYYYKKYGCDIRSLRYPGLISYKSLPGGGTTDYAVEIYIKAIEEGKYTCYLKEDAALPMMYMPDAINATIEITEAKAENIKIRSSYNLGAFSFSPSELAASIKEQIPEFQISYQPDSRQAIAEGWPSSIDDNAARNDWGWSPDFDVDGMTIDMIDNLKKKLKTT